MPLLQESAIYLTFKCLHLIQQVCVIVFCSLTLVSEFGLELNCLLTELVERVLVLTITSTNLILYIAKLQVHLGS